MENIKEIINYSLVDKDELYDREHRRLYFNGDVDEAVIDSFVYMIMKYNREDIGIPIENRKPIILYINSPGGDLVSGYSIIDCVILSKTPVYTVNVGEACSMGLLIFISGKKKYAFPRSEFLLHDGSSFFAGTTSKMKDRMEFETHQLEKLTKDYILKYTNITEELYNEKYKDEWYFLPQEAKRIGVVDYIVGEDCDIDEII